jgi:hypothetical protein
MKDERALRVSDRWFRLLRRLYPPDFRDDMGEALVETYRDRARDALRRGGRSRLVSVWLRALMDALRNGPGERLRPAAPWRRHGDWGRDAEMALRRLVRARTFAATTIATLAIGLGMVAVAVTGGVDIRRAPGARIRVDGLIRGTSPLRVLDLTPGTHDVLFETRGGKMHQPVQVQAE